MLTDSKVALLFVEVASLSRARTFYEDVLGLTVIENQFNPPHHRHGIVKYDAGDTILALNLADASFDTAAEEPIVTGFSGGPRREAEIYAELQIRGFAAPYTVGGEFRDADGHRFRIQPVQDYALWHGPDALGVEEIGLAVENIRDCRAFYEDVLGLMPLRTVEGATEFATGNVRIRLFERQSADSPRRNSYLPVFYTADIRHDADLLERRGVEFPQPVRFSEIGGAVRFRDPVGNQFCLYQPSEVSLTWDSGPKLREIMSGQVPVSARARITGLLSRWVV
jgi:catechol 2,3-dioxygenase-like lactoylglutathione lyase family enzyme